MSKIALVSHSYPTRQSPEQASFIKREAHLIAESQSVEIHLPSVYALPFQQQYFRSRDPDENLIPVHRFSYLSFPGRRFASNTQKSLSKNLLRSLERQIPNVVHLHWLYPSGLAAPAIKLAGYPVLLTIHGGDWYSNINNKRLMPILEKCLHSCDKIICVGKQLKEDIGRFSSTLSKKLIHIPHGIDTNRFYPSAKDRQNLPVSGWDIDKINILCVANLYHEKGIDLLIRAFSKLHDKEQHHLHIISAGGDSRTKSEIDLLIKKLSIQNQTTFHRSQTHDQLADIYRASDLLVSPSRKEGFGLVVAEAIACGTPVLATRSGGPEEIINSECGTLVAAGNAKSLSDGLVQILEKLDEYQSEEMHQYIKTCFSVSAKRKRLLSVYDDVVS